MRWMYLSVVAATLAVSGCASFPLPDTAGDPKNAPNYGYHPLDPLPVNVTLQTPVTNENLMKVLPDETMRLAIGTVSGDGGISYGPAKIGIEGSSYVVILDYIKFGTESFGVDLTGTGDNRVATLVQTADADSVVPVYIGVGLRMTASIHVKKGKVDLGNLFALGAAAKAERVSGSLVVQTLGISGPEVSSLIPMPAEINQSTIQNAILSLASIKAKMYADETLLTPRVVGVYNNLGGGTSTINGFISSLLQKRLDFPSELADREPAVPGAVQPATPGTQPH